ncbi:MAG: Sua5/YciO/YrdC/YwlC family protein [Eubacteriales bacterium]
MSLRNNGKQKEGITIETKRLNGNCAEDIVIAAELLKNGGLVAIPTETVYGLGSRCNQRGSCGTDFLKPRQTTG